MGHVEESGFQVHETCRPCVRCARYGAKVETDHVLPNMFAGAIILFGQVALLWPRSTHRCGKPASIRHLWNCLCVNMHKACSVA